MSAGEGLRLFLARLSSRSELDTSEQDALLSLPGALVDVPPNRDFVRMGEVVSHACLVVDGLTGRFGQTRSGERQITSLHIPGDMVDLHSAVVPKAPAALMALCKTQILKVPHAALLEISRKHPRIAEAFWRDCVVDGAISAQWVINVGRRDSQTRLAHLLCEMAVRYNEISEDHPVSFHFPATQAQLGDATGMTSVHLNRTLRALREKGLVEQQKSLISIPRWSALTKFAEFDSTYLALTSPMEAHDGPS